MIRKLLGATGVFLVMQILVSAAVTPAPSCSLSDLSWSKLQVKSPTIALIWSVAAATSPS